MPFSKPNAIKLTLSLSTILFLASCSTTTKKPEQDGPAPYKQDVSHVQNAVPKYEPLSRYGNPKSYTVLGKTYHLRDSRKNYDQKGIASWYGYKFHGNRTSSGEPYNMFGMTAAHKTLPIPVYARVTNLENGRSIVVKINDRGPFHENRIIDLSYAAAKKLDMMKTGTALVDVQTITPGQKESYVNTNHKPHLYVQLGAFSEEINAKNLEAELKAKNFAANKIHIKPGLSNNHVVYRVQMGPVNVSQSDELLARLERDGYPHAWTTVK